jgi:hypothetical protein
MGSFGESLLPQNGDPAYEHEIVDSDDDGIPNYELIRAFPDREPGWFLLTTQIIANLSEVKRPNFQSPFFWPYLQLVDTTWTLRRVPEDDDPPIKFSWQDSQLKGVQNFLPLWGLGNQWIAVSNFDFQKHVTNYLDWEVFAFYDFNNDTMMDMNFRNVYYSSLSVPGYDQILYPLQVNYSWHHKNIDQLVWDYKLELIGLHELPTSVIEFPDFSVYAIPFDEFLTQRLLQDDWAYATFVAAESYGSSEGIWEWSTFGGVIQDMSLIPGQYIVPDSAQAQRAYLLGVIDTPPVSFYNKIRRGLRGEFAFLNGVAGLYFSPIDRQLHLLHANKGTWNLDENREIIYKNLGGEVINEWELWQDGEEIKKLVHVDDYIYFVENNRVDILKVDVSPILFTTLPPSNTEEWIQLGANLEKYKPSFAPDDFKSMFQQFSGESISINGANLRDFRITEYGLRFILELRANYTIIGPDWLGIQGQPPGDYLVKLNDYFNTVSVTPAQMNLVIESQVIDVSEVGSIYGLKLVATNSGILDSEELVVSLHADCGKGPILLLQETTNVLGEDQLDWQLIWQKLEEDNCQLTASLDTLKEIQVAQVDLDIPATAEKGNLVVQVLRISTQDYQLLPAFVVLGILGTLTGLAFWLTLRSEDRKSGRK